MTRYNARQIRLAQHELRLIMLCEGTACKQSVLCANELMEVILDQPFTILVTNFTNAPRRLSKYMKISWARPSLDNYVPLPKTIYTDALVNTIATVERDEFRLRKLKPICVQSHVAQSQKEVIIDTKDWHDTVQIGSAFED